MESARYISSNLVEDLCRTSDSDSYVKWNNSTKVRFPSPIFMKIGEIHRKRYTKLYAKYFPSGNQYFLGFGGEICTDFLNFGPNLGGF